MIYFILIDTISLYVKYTSNKDKNVHRFELRAMKGELLERERGREKERERKREIWIGKHHWALQ